MREIKQNEHTTPTIPKKPLYKGKFKEFILTQDARRRRNQIHNATKRYNITRPVLKNGKQFFVFVSCAKALSRECLTELFKSCGTIIDIQVRCFGGQAIAPEVAALRHTLDRQYASIHFKSPRAVQNALKKHGDECNGHKLFVVLSPGGLPEAQELKRRHDEEVATRNWQDELGKSLFEK